MADKWRPKLTTELPAHALTILDKVDQQVRTKPSATKNGFLSRHGTPRGTSCMQWTPVASALIAK